MAVSYAPVFHATGDLMALVRLKAVVDLEHRGERIAAGTVFEATELETLPLAYHKKVTFASSASVITRDMDAGSPDGRKKRQYRRRDLVPE